MTAAFALKAIVIPVYAIAGYWDEADATWDDGPARGAFITYWSIPASMPGYKTSPLLPASTYGYWLDSAITGDIDNVRFYSSEGFAKPKWVV